MANPEVIYINKKWKWVKIATGITVGSIHLINTGINYYRTYRMTGESAPSNPSGMIIPNEAIQIFINTTEELIRLDEAIDVYLFCVGNSKINGKVVVDV